MLEPASLHKTQRAVCPSGSMAVVSLPDVVP